MDWILEDSRTEATDGHRHTRKSEHDEPHTLATDSDLLDEVGKPEVCEDDVVNESVERAAAPDSRQPREEDGERNGGAGCDRDEATQRPSRGRRWRRENHRHHSEP